MKRYQRTVGGLVGLIAAVFLAGTVLSTAQAANPPQIEYVLVLNAHGKPQTSFRPGATVGLRVELYLVARNASRAKAVWHLTSGRHTYLHRVLSGNFQGPTRGNLFTQVETLKLASDAASGTYTASVTIAVDGRHLFRSARFYVHR